MTNKSIDSNLERRFINEPIPSGEVEKVLYFVDDNGSIHPLHVSSGGALWTPAAFSFLLIDDDGKSLMVGSETDAYGFEVESEFVLWESLSMLAAAIESSDAP